MLPLLGGQVIAARLTIEDRTPDPRRLSEVVSEADGATEILDHLTRRRPVALRHLGCHRQGYELTRPHVLAAMIARDRCRSHFATQPVLPVPDSFT